MKKSNTVIKKSGKPFQNGRKTAVIEFFTTMTIPLGNKQPGTQDVDAVHLVGCIGPVRSSQLQENEDG